MQIGLPEVTYAIGTLDRTAPSLFGRFSKKYGTLREKRNRDVGAEQKAEVSDDSFLPSPELH